VPCCMACSGCPCRLLQVFGKTQNQKVSLRMQQLLSGLDAAREESLRLQHTFTALLLPPRRKMSSLQRFTILDLWGCMHVERVKESARLEDLAAAAAPDDLQLVVLDVLDDDLVLVLPRTVRQQYLLLRRFRLRCRLLLLLPLLRLTWLPLTRRLPLMLLRLLLLPTALPRLPPLLRMRLPLRTAAVGSSRSLLKVFWRQGRLLGPWRRLCGRAGCVMCCGP